MNRNKKIFAGSMAAVLLLGASSLAWFTDRTEGSIEGQAGSLCLTEIKNEHDLLNLAPGDERPIELAYENLGSLAMDTRVTYALSYEIDGEVADAIENDLDVIAHLYDDEEEVLTLTKDGKAIVTVDGVTLKGTKEEKGVDTLDKHIKFKFDESVGNIGQKMKFKLDVLVEGKQNRNNPEWDLLNKVSYTISGESVEVVPWSACNASDSTQDDSGSDEIRDSKVIKLNIAGLEAFGVESEYLITEGDVFPVSEAVGDEYGKFSEYSILGSRPNSTLKFDITEERPTFETLYEKAEAGEFFMNAVRDYSDDNGNTGYEIDVTLHGYSGGMN